MSKYGRIFFLNFFFKHYHDYVPVVSQANWCNMTFTAGNLFPSHSCIGWPGSSPNWDSNLCPQFERQPTYQLSYPSLLNLGLIGHVHLESMTHWSVIQFVCRFMKMCKIMHKDSDKTVYIYRWYCLNAGQCNVNVV